MQVLREQLTRVAGHDTHTLLTGEPGSGREACARYLASLSDRADAPFVALKAGGRDDDKAVSLLGDDRGPGALERAAAGVLFISEITDMPADAQRELLAVLEQGRFRPGEGAEQQDLNVRMLSSAPPDFEQAADGFRRELLFHLSVVVVRVPPLRDYLEDVPELLRCKVD
ncbi:MAG: sigma 54-interacting transcriptional regulator, partial [Rhodospirillaceae bacterium]|nr:sigma 54-interacting transcriptional regulator [Rhodospirillaceae bacterium]